MSAGWVAATNRGRSLLRRTLGTSGTTSLARARSWEDARTQLTRTMYGTELSSASSRHDAHMAAVSSTSWQLQVLAGWCPPNGGGLASVFAAPLEIADIEHQLAVHSSSVEPGGPVASPMGRAVALGALANTAPRLRNAKSAGDARQILARSPWGDPGATDPVTVALHLRVSWLVRLMRRIPRSRGIVLDAMAVLAARERFAFERDVAPASARELDRHIGVGWRSAHSVGALAAALPSKFSVLSTIESADDLWQAEIQIRTNAAAAAGQWAKGSSFSEQSVAGIMALLLIDLSRTTSAIELAGRGPLSPELLDVLA